MPELQYDSETADGVNDNSGINVNDQRFNILHGFIDQFRPCGTHPRYIYNIRAGQFYVGNPVMSPWLYAWLHPQCAATLALSFLG